MEIERENIALETIERKGRLFLLTFSNGFEVRATKGIINRLELTEQREFSPSGFDDLKAFLEERYAIYCAESLLARRAYSIGEFKDRLRQKDIAADLIRQVVKDFREQGLLDDFKYAEMRIRSVIGRKPAGRGYLIADLRNHLVPREIADKAVDKTLEDTDEVEMGVRLLEKRRAAFDKFDIETARRKAYTYLSGRAISYGAAREAFNKVFDNSEK